jgi:uncharacterized OB-fold protein
VTEETSPFFAAAERGVLALQRCQRCQSFAFPERKRCPRCSAAELHWVDASGRGRVWSHGVLRRSALPEHQAQLPFTLVWVELDEGPRFATRLAKGESGAVKVGDPVQIRFESLDDGVLAPVVTRA